MDKGEKFKVLLPCPIPFLPSVALPSHLLLSPISAPIPPFSATLNTHILDAAGCWMPCQVHVRGSMSKTKKSSRFFSFRSFIAGAKNNIVGMFGFVKEGRASDDAFKERIENEKRLMEEVARRKAAKAAEGQQKP